MTNFWDKERDGGGGVIFDVTGCTYFCFYQRVMAKQKNISRIL
jgi:hypothetical protein